MSSWFFLVGFVFSALVCYDAASDVGWLKALAACFGWVLAFIAGSGAKGALVAGQTAQQLTGIALGVLALIGSLFIAYWTGIVAGIFGVKFSWIVWCAGSAVLFFILTTRRDAEGTPPA